METETEQLKHDQTQRGGKGAQQPTLAFANKNMTTEQLNNLLARQIFVPQFDVASGGRIPSCPAFTITTTTNTMTTTTTTTTTSNVECGITRDSTPTGHVKQRNIFLAGE